MATPAVLGTLVAASAATSIAGGVIGARNARDEAKALKRLGKAEYEDKKIEGRRLVAAQQAAFAAGGVAVDSGTALDLASDTVAETELAALRTKFSRDSQAESLRTQADQAQLQGILSGANTVLGAGFNAKLAGII